MTERRIEIRPVTAQEKESIIASVQEHTREVGGVVTDNNSVSVFMYEGDKLIASVVGYSLMN